MTNNHLAYLALYSYHQSVNPDDLDIPKRVEHDMVCGHNPIWNNSMCLSMIKSCGLSVMYRQDSAGYDYWHAQRGPEEPENHTLSTHTSLNCAVVMCMVKCVEGDVSIPEWWVDKEVGIR